MFMYGRKVTIMTSSLNRARPRCRPQCHACCHSPVDSPKASMCIDWRSQIIMAAKMCVLLLSAEKRGEQTFAYWCSVSLTHPLSGRPLEVDTHLLLQQGPIALSAAVSTVAFLFFHPHYTHTRPSEYPMRDAVWRFGSIHFSQLMIRSEGSRKAVFTNLLSEKCTAKFQSQFQQ